MATMLRQTQLVVEVLVRNTPKLTQTQLVVEAHVRNETPLRVYELAVEALAGGEATAPIRFYSVAVEVLLVESVGTTYNVSLSISGLSDFTITPGTAWPLSRSLDGVSNLTLLDGAGYAKSLTVDGFSSVALASAYGVNAPLTIAGVADVAFAPGFGTTLTISGQSAASVVATVSIYPAVTLAGVCDFLSPGGVVYEKQRSIEGLSGISLLPGFGYFDTCDIDGISDIAQVEQRFQNDTLTIEGVADFATTSTYGVNAPLAIAGIAVFAIAENWSAVNSLTVSALAGINVENIYEILLATNAISTFTASVERFTAQSQNPSAAGSFSATCTGVFRRTVTHTLAMIDSATYKKPTAITAQTLAITQTLALQRIRNLSVTQSLILTQDATGARGSVQTLTIAQTATCVRVRSRTVVQTLELTQAATRNTVLGRTVSQTLTFNVPRQRVTPMIGPQSGQFQYNEPLINVGLTPRTCLVILGTAARIIVLPCPIFGDSQAYTGELNLKKTMTGQTYTYVKKTQTERLKYTFQLGTYKAVELREFLLGQSQEIITLRNWKGETWYVFLMNNPFEFTRAARWQPRGERVDVTLEFEGVRT